MKKLLLFLAAITAMQVSVRATVYEQVTDLSAITAGEKYLIVAYHPSWTTQNRVVYLNSEGTVTTAALSSVTPGELTSSGVTEEQAFWSFTAPESAVACSYHTDYTVFNAAIDSSFFNFSSATPSTTGSEDATFFHLAAVSDYAGYFNIHYNFQGSSNKYSWAVNSSSEFGYGTNNSASTKTIFNDYTWLFGIYHANSDDAAFATYKESVVAGLKAAKEQYTGVDITDDITAAEAVEYATSYEASAAAIDSIAAQAYGKIATYYTGRYVTILNVGNSNYLKNDGSWLTNGGTRDLDAVWKIASSSWNGSAFDVKLYSPTYQTYLGSLTAFASNTSIPVVTLESDAVAYSATPVDGHYAFATTGFTTTSAYPCLHVNNAVVSGKVIYWSATANSQWDLSLIEETEIRSMISDAADEIEALFVGGLNNYTTTAGNTADIVAALQEAAKDSSKSVDEICQTYHSQYTAAFNGATLTMPEAGRYLRIHSGPTWCTTNNWEAAPYLSSTNYDTTHASFVTEKDASTILYYTGENLISFQGGRYAKGSSMLYFTTDAEGATGNTGATVAFEEGTNEAGTYFVHYYNNGRYMYTGTTLSTNGGSSTDASGGYNFQLEYVDALPLTIGTVGYATLCVPAAVTIPADATGCEFYTASLSDVNMVITPAAAGTAVAASTPIFVTGEEGTTINFPITTEAVDSVANTSTISATFVGNNAWQTYTPQEGFVAYIPQITAAAETETETEGNETDTPASAPAISRAAEAATGVTFVELAEGDELPANVPVLSLATNAIGSEAVATFTANIAPNQSTTISLTSATSSISELNAEVTPAAAAYDLMGRRILSPRPGQLRIQGGKLLR
jgi:hypothetical protein